VYLRLSTRSLEQPARTLGAARRDEILAGGYWLIPPGPAAEVAIVASGPVVAEALVAHAELREDLPDTGLLVVTSADRLERGWRRGAGSHVEALLGSLPASAGLVTVLDGHPATLSWLAAVRQHRVAALGVDRFGQSGDIADLYAAYGIDAEAIVAAAARLIAP
jgi:pyruvate dehydrogenase E1 component